MTVKEYNEKWHPLYEHAYVFIHALEHNIEKANSSEEALRNLKILGWNEDLKRFFKESIDSYRSKTISELE